MNKPAAIKRGHWSPRELEILAEIYPVKTDKACGKQLRRSAAGIKKKARRLGLQKTRGHISVIRSEARTAQLVNRTVDEAHDKGREIIVLDSPGPGWGPRTIHRIAA